LAEQKSLLLLIELVVGILMGMLAETVTGMEMMKVSAMGKWMEL